MTDSLKLDMFNDAYKAATAANARGDTATAKKMFLRAAEIMEDLAETSAPPLDSSRRERAKKLRFIAQNLQSQSAVSAAEKSGEVGTEFISVTKPDQKISFDDIIGLDGAKSAIHSLLIDSLKSPEVYKRYGIKAGGFILLEGPPGTGKTTFAKAAACEISVPFCEVNANALVDSYIGKTGKNIDKLFDEARALSKREGSAVVLFIDEIDYLAQKRGGDNKTASEAVPTLIKQMDGFSTSSDDIVLIAATNIKEALDPAILSRFRNVISIPLPNTDERKAIFVMKLNNIPQADIDSIDFTKAAELSEGLSGRDINQISLELKSALAARDASLRDIGMSVGELLTELIKKRRKSL